MKIIKIIFLLFFIIFLSNISFAYLISFELGSEQRSSINVEFDPYYSNIDWTQSLTRDPIPKTIMTSELDFYSHMLKNMHLPRYLLVEASVYPLPIAGVYTKRHANDFYNNMEIFPGFNVVKAITEDFPEPWALSLFFGNVNDFLAVEDGDIVGKGYGGLLFSVGNKHIVDNIMVSDNWVETEIKLKGTSFKKAYHLSWSYAIGAKFHDNSDIANALYFSIKRNRVDFNAPKGNPILNFFAYNSEQELHVAFDMSEFYLGKLTKTSFLFGKSYPTFDNKVALSFGIGAVKFFPAAYSGQLKSRIHNDWSLILRPNIRFEF